MVRREALPSVLESVTSSGTLFTRLYVASWMLTADRSSRVATKLCDKSRLL
jgi:hypothetical protein